MLRLPNKITIQPKITNLLHPIIDNFLISHVNLHMKPKILSRTSLLYTGMSSSSVDWYMLMIARMSIFNNCIFLELSNNAIALLSRSLLNKLPMKGGEIMGYGGYQGGNYGGDCGYGNSGGNGSAFVLIVVLFILLIIVGASFAY